MTREMARMVAETELLLSGVAKTQSQIGFQAFTMMIVVNMSNGDALNVSAIDFSQVGDGRHSRNGAHADAPGCGAGNDAKGEAVRSAQRLPRTRGAVTMPRYRVHGVIACDAPMGEVDAANAKDAIEKAWQISASPSVCHQCAREMNVGDVYKLIVENVADDNDYLESDD